jgi:hypothetical protein
MPPGGADTRRVSRPDIRTTKVECRLRPRIVGRDALSNPESNPRYVHAASGTRFARTRLEPGVRYETNR